MTRNCRTIVFITPSLGAGGIERVVSNLSYYISKKENYTVTIICFSKKPIFYPIPDEVCVKYLPKAKIKALDLLIKIRALRSALKSIKPNAAISFGSMYNSFFLISAFGLNFKKYVSDRSNPWRNARFTFKKGGLERHDGPLHFLLKQISYRTATGILTQTKLSTAIEQKAFGTKKVIYFPNPVEKFPEADAGKRLIILNVGRFTESKAQLELIDIFSELPLFLRENWQLVFLGGGTDYFNKCKQRVKELKLDDLVIFEDFQKDVNKWYAIAEIFAFTSYSEGFPNALAEAMSAGCACISYDCDAGPSDLMINKHNGLLVPLGDKASYLEALTLLLTDSVFRKQIQEEATKVSDQFNGNRIIDNLLNEIF